MTQPNFDEVAREIIAKASIVLDEPIPSGTTALHYYKTEKLIASALRKAVEDERAECARVAESYYCTAIRGGHVGIAEVIRSRGGKKEDKCRTI